MVVVGLMKVVVEWVLEVVFVSWGWGKLVTRTLHAEP